MCSDGGQFSGRCMNQPLKIVQTAPEFRVELRQAFTIDVVIHRGKKAPGRDALNLVS